jgi:predicted  nucleic acid-binding Zn-ribbon protein
MSRPLDTVVALQEALRRLAAAEARLRGIPDWMQELHGEHSAQRLEIDELDAAVTQAAAERRAAEGDIAEAQEKLKHYQQQISLVRTQREYGALLHEIDTVKSRIKSLEEQALAAMARHEEAQRQLASRREAFADLDQRYGAELARWESEKPEVARQAEGLRAEIADLERRLPPPVLQRFNRVFERLHGEALAAVHRVDRGGRGPQIWSCGACNYRVRPQVVVEINDQGSLIECDSCKRILYLGGDHP